MLFNELQWRGLIKNCTHNFLNNRLNSPIVLYVGFDPTSDSLHVGNLVQILALQRAQKLGHTPIALIGGATALIGDPSGKNSERNLIETNTIENNIVGIQQQLRQFLDCSNSIHNSAKIVNNIEWFKGISYLSFLRDIGKHISVNQMLARDSVKTRMETGISYTEFSYMLAQGYDFLQLNQKYHCELQIGGSDQWGNIVTGLELIKKILGKEVFGLTQPLIVNSSGKKIGKTEKGTIFLDKNKTNIFDFYQFFRKTEDQDVIQFLKFFSNFTPEQVQEVEESFIKEPEKQEAQKLLASSVTELVHGKEEATKVALFSQTLFYNMKNISTGEVIHTIGKEELEKGVSLLNLISPIQGWFTSKSDARRVMLGKGIRVNGVTIDNPSYILTTNNIEGEHIIIEKGKQHKHVIQLIKKE